MTTALTTTAEEESTYVITAAFEDEDGDAVTPDSITWSLTDNDGSIINGREDVSIAVPAASNDIVLSGDDLAIQSSESGTARRWLILEAVYDSDIGANLPLKDDAVFVITDLKKVT